MMSLTADSPGAGGNLSDPIAAEAAQKASADTQMSAATRPRSPRLTSQHRRFLAMGL